MSKISIVFWLTLAGLSYSETRYVVQNNPNAAAPYTTWSNAAATIQDAVDVSVSNDIVLVTNGMYETGGRTANGTLTNRVVIDNPVIVRSVKGPEVTIIKGNADPQYTNGESAVRCVYLGTNATLIGFTLTNGHTRVSYDNDAYGGGIYCEPSAILSNCILTGNSAKSGGGVRDGTLYNCTLTGNLADYGGGGAYGSTLHNCALIDNTSLFIGGGASGSMLYNCALIGNSADSRGGGVGDGTLYNCVLTGNSADWGGGVYVGNLYNCTLTGNSARNGGGIGGGTLYNCIVYYNVAEYGSNIGGGEVNYCCTTPDPGGTGNITNEPILASASHLSENSPCIGKGSATYASGMDIDGEAWFNPPSIGCDEVHTGAAIDPLNVAMTVSYGYVRVGFPVAFIAQIEGHATASCWDFGDGIVISNHPYISHAWSSEGIYPVTLTAWNESVPQGVSTTLNVAVMIYPVHYVKTNSPTPVFPFISWDTAASNIQDAVNAAAEGNIILVTNGVYEIGGRTANGTLTNRVVIDKPLVVRSVNGPETTIIKGAGPAGDTAIRCVYLGTNATLIGFTLTNGHTGTSGIWPPPSDTCGGGIFCEPTAVLSNCILIDNSASHEGGGTYGGTLYNCMLTGNSVAHEGGGVLGGTLYNCTLTGNASDSGGGGTFGSILYNCIIYYNTAAFDDNFSGGTLNYCCTTPDPGGIGNITNEPIFVDSTGGDLHLQSNSPCINRGINQDWMVGSTDLDGNPRIRRSQGDMGAYESDDWGQFSDLDADRLSDWIEVYRTGTDPTNAASYLGMWTPFYSDSEGTGIVVRWQSVNGKLYRLVRSTNLTEDFVSLTNHLNATPPMNVYTDQTITGQGPWFYRLGVE